jgi:type VI secretion system secreted protein Hcp
MAIYLKIDGIDGDVTAEGHEKWINCESLSLGVARAIHTPTGSSQERESSAPSISEIVLTKVMDVSSAKLFQEACVGKSKAVKIDLVKTGDKLENYLEYTLTNCLISGYSVSSGGDKPSESLSLNFTKIEMKYTPYDNEHNPQSPMPAGYDISLGKKL